MVDEKSELERIVTKGSNMVPDKVMIENGTDREFAEFLWGIVYQREVPNAELFQSKIVQVTELTYEGLSKKFYSVTPESLEKLKSNSEVYGVKDISFIMFGKDEESAKELYKAFFMLLNGDLLGGRINREEYMKVFNSVRWHYKMLMWTVNKELPELDRAVNVTKTIDKFRLIFKIDPDISPYLDRARQATAK